MTLTWVETALVPQITTQSDFAITRGSEPRMAPAPMANPVQAMLVQKLSNWLE